MITQAHLIGQDYSVYTHLVAVAGILCLLMALCTVRLVRRKRSCRFIGLVWGGFLILVCFGSLGLSLSIHSERLLWRSSCARLAATYANILCNLHHEKIQPGHPEMFSDWSSPLLLPANPKNSLDFPDDINESSVKSARPEQFAVPDGFVSQWEPLSESSISEKPLQVLRRNQWAVAELTQDHQAFDHCRWQIAVRWNAVPNATTYRLQWANRSSDETQWISVYSGSKTSCSLAIPERIDLAFRVRAEDGTPEDDAHYNQIIDILDFPVKANALVGYTYTMRFVNQQSVQFIASPISDANHNGFIDPKEVPNDIGELFPAVSLFQYVHKHHERAMKIEEIVDQWGKWFTVAEPLRTADGKIDGILAMDFDANYMQRQLSIGQIYPFFLFLLVTCFYIGAVFVINHLQTKNEKINGLLKELQGVVVELTEAKHTTEKALQVKTFFLNNMSHEFRTPLNAILGFSEILTMRITQCAEADRGVCCESIKHIKDNGNKLIELVNNVLDLAAADGSQTTALMLTPTNISALIAEIAEGMQCRSEAKSLTLIVKEDVKIPEWVESNASRIRQILVHLIGNAIKFTQQGTITIHYGLVQENCPKDMPMLYVSVSDTGIGIDTKHLSAIFKPFLQIDPSLTRKYGGTGIGLSVARQAAEMLNGTIAVESQLDKGSTFTFAFPGRIVDPRSARNVLGY